MSTIPARDNPATSSMRGRVSRLERADDLPPRPLGAPELRRRIWHMAPGLMPLILWAIPHADPLSPLINGIFIGIFLVLTGMLFWNWSHVARSHVGNGDRAAAIFGYAGTVLLVLFLFPAHAEIGMALLSVLAFGDGSATLFGKRMGGARLPWNPEKSVTGFVAFLLIGLPLTTVMYWGESHNLQAIGPPATFAQSLLISAAGVLAGAVAESVPSRINDNIRVGVAAAIALVLAHAATVGL